jgi:hypothetical protein
MNLKKLFGLFKKEDEDKEDDDDIAALLGDLKEPRSHHYLFAHRYLPGITFQMGVTTLLILGDPEKSNVFLQEIWADVAAENDISQEDQIAPEPLNATLQQIGDKLVALIQLPPAERTTEAHLVAIVSDLPPELTDDTPEGIQTLRERLRQTPIRYFTLECGFSLDDTPRTVFCEWTREAHLNMGDGPAPTREALLKFLIERDLVS